MIRTKKPTIKQYPHFDGMISLNDAEQYASCPQRVAAHAFFPLILHEKSWNKWAPAGSTGKSKSRPIRYAARLDSFLFWKYREHLIPVYEQALKTLRIDDTVTAYRRIVGENGRGKSNIDFAKNVFDNIKSLDQSIVLALDISKFFENIDHETIKSKWLQITGKTRLNDDEFSILQAATKYSFVDRQKLYERLGYIGPVLTKSGRMHLGYTCNFRSIPKRLCSIEDFRNKVCGDGVVKSLIQKNYKNHGIAQGLPISDLLANISMIDFDANIDRAVRSVGGVYYRYSDDIIIVIPDCEDNGKAMMDLCRKEVTDVGRKLIIKDEKSFVYKFERKSPGALTYTLITSAAGAGANGLEYLGFRFDGKNVYIRDATLSNLWRSSARVAAATALRYKRRYSDKTSSEIWNLVDKEAFIQEFGRVKDFDEKRHLPKEWTFLTYAKKSAEAFGGTSSPISAQLRRHRRILLEKLEKAIFDKPSHGVY